MFYHRNNILHTQEPFSPTDRNTFHASNEVTVSHCNRFHINPLALWKRIITVCRYLLVLIIPVQTGALGMGERVDLISSNSFKMQLFKRGTPVSWREDLSYTNLRFAGTNYVLQMIWFFAGTIWCNLIKCVFKYFDIYYPTSYDIIIFIFILFS